MWNFRLFLYNRYAIYIQSFPKNVKIFKIIEWSRLSTIVNVSGGLLQFSEMGNRVFSFVFCVNWYPNSYQGNISCVLEYLSRIIGYSNTHENKIGPLWYETEFCLQFQLGSKTCRIGFALEKIDIIIFYLYSLIIQTFYLFPKYKLNKIDTLYHVH